MRIPCGLATCACIYTSSLTSSLMKSLTTNSPARLNNVHIISSVPIVATVSQGNNALVNSYEGSGKLVYRYRTEDSSSLSGANADESAVVELKNALMTQEDFTSAALNADIWEYNATLSCAVFKTAAFE